MGSQARKLSRLCYTWMFNNPFAKSR